MTRRAVLALGINQCVNWGVLYYAFAVLVLPLERELDVSAWVVTGAFSLALLMSAVLAPRVGLWCDRGRGPMVMQGGGILAAGLLALWTVLPGVAALYAIWAGLGVCMAMTLYEPAFVIVGRAYDDPSQRLRALAAITLLGGLASTVFLPLAAVLVATWGWRSAVLVLAAVLITSSAIARTFVFRHTRPSARIHTRDSTEPPVAARLVDPPRWLLITNMFAMASLASAAFSANLVPALSERGISPASAAALGGLTGVMQLPGRALLMNGALEGAPTRFLTLSLTLHAAGLGAVAFAPSVMTAAAGTATFALGAGLTTLVRPHLVQSMMGGAGGHLNGRIARQQQLARAVGPLAVAWLAEFVGYAAVFAGIAAVFGAVNLSSQRWLRGIGHAGSRPSARSSVIRHDDGRVLSRGRARVHKNAHGLILHVRRAGRLQSAERTEST